MVWHSGMKNIMLIIYKALLFSGRFLKIIYSYVQLNPLKKYSFKISNGKRDTNTEVIIYIYIIMDYLIH